MLRRAVVIALVAFLMDGYTFAAAESQPVGSRRPNIRVIGETTIVGESDPALWKAVLDLLPVRPRRIELLDRSVLPQPAQQKLRGLDAFVLSGQTTIVVLRQSATLRQAETGDTLDRLVLASLVWHEMAHVNGQDEVGAFAAEQDLWRRFVKGGLIDLESR